MSESIRDRLRRILSGKLPKVTLPQPARASQPVDVPAFPSPASSASYHVPPFTASIDTPPAPEPPKVYNTPLVLREIDPAETRMPTDIAGARVFLANLRVKMASLAEDFALGKINRQQFETIYVHYREQRQMVESLLTSMASSAWRKAVSEGETGILMQRSEARVLSYALYDNTSSLLLASTGQFKLDPALVIPMLSAYRSATAEIFGASISSSEIEGGRWLCFVPGRFTTFIVLFSLEPARAQLTLLEDLHRDFETANAEPLSQGKGQEPAEQFMRLWVLEHTV